MKHTTLMTLASTMATLLSATPLEPRAEGAPAANILVPGVKGPHPEAPERTVSVYVCRDVNFGGTCQNLASNSNQCCKRL